MYPGKSIYTQLFCMLTWAFEWSRPRCLLLPHYGCRYTLERNKQQRIWWSRLFVTTTKLPHLIKQQGLNNLASDATWIAGFKDAICCIKVTSLRDTGVIWKSFLQTIWYIVTMLLGCSKHWVIFKDGVGLFFDPGL